MTHEIEIDGCLNVPTTVSLNDVVDEFLAFIENRGWYFGGGFNEFFRNACVLVCPFFLSLFLSGRTAICCLG